MPAKATRGRVKPTAFILAAMLSLSSLAFVPEASAHICEYPDRYCGNYCPPFSGPHNHACLIFLACYQRICIVIYKNGPLHLVESLVQTDVAALP